MKGDRGNQGSSHESIALRNIRGQDKVLGGETDDRPKGSG